MKYLKLNAVKILLAVSFMGLSTQVIAQDKQAAFDAYNNALEAAKAEEYNKAIELFNQAISEAEKLGDEEGKDIVQRAQKQLPSIHYQSSLADYKTFQQEKSLASLENTIESFRETSQVASELNNSDIASKADQVVTQLLYSKSLLQFQTEDYQGSLASLDQAIDRNPNYAKAYYQKGIVSKRQDGNSLDEILNYFDQAIEIGQKTNDSQTVERAQESASDELVYRGANAVQNKNYSEAISLLNRALEYQANSADAYYRLAEAYNKRGEWNSAIENATQALEYETGGRTDRAKIYFELGMAYKGQGNKEQACDAFSDAAYGSFKNVSEHEMEFELECD